MEVLGGVGRFIHVRTIHAVQEGAFVVLVGIRMNTATREWNDWVEWGGLFM
jgi:hypothetical protein